MHRSTTINDLSFTTSEQIFFERVNSMYDATSSIFEAFIIQILCHATRHWKKTIWFVTLFLKFVPLCTHSLVDQCEYQHMFWKMSPSMACWNHILGRESFSVWTPDTVFSDGAIAALCRWPKIALFGSAIRTNKATHRLNSMHLWKIDQWIKLSRELDYYWLTCYANWITIGLLLYNWSEAHTTSIFGFWHFYSFLQKLNNQRRSFFYGFCWSARAIGPIVLMLYQVFDSISQLTNSQNCMCLLHIESFFFFITIEIALGFPRTFFDWIVLPFQPIESLKKQKYGLLKYTNWIKWFKF